MSTFAVRHTPRSKSASDLLNLALIGPKLVASSLEQASQVVRLGSNLIAGAVPALPSIKRSSCCEIPEEECPPRCVCEIEWEASAGERLKATIHFTNSSANHARTFLFSATAFSGAGNPQAPLIVSP